jgi:F-type H+-transporting ATPase subunit b
MKRAARDIWAGLRAAAGRPRHSRRDATIVRVTICMLLLLLTTAVGQQSSGSPTQSEQRQVGGESGAQTATPAAESAKESREAAGEDETAQFKQSASVKFLAKLTGLSLDHAYWLSVLVNFAVVAGLIFWLSKKNLPGMFRNRTASIQKAMEEARKASQEANRRLADIDTRLSKLDVEIGSMHAAAEKEAAAEEARIKAAAVEDTHKIVELAEQEIAAAAKSARRELTAYAADLAVSLATKQIKVDSATDQALIRSFAQQLSADGGASRKDTQ